MKHFTCIGRSHGAPAIPATREDWEKMRRERKLADMCRSIAAGNEKLKRMLPIWTPCCAEFKNNHRAVKDATKPLPRLMLDFDEKGHSQEILEKSIELQKAGKWEILLVEESVRRGTHVLISLPEGMSPQEAQQHFSEDVGFQADPALKDVARCIYMVPESHTLYVNERMFSMDGTQRHGDTESAHFVIQSEAKNLCNIAKQKVDVPEILRRDAPLDDNSNALNKTTSSFPSTHENIPYEQIVEVLEEQMGGKPDIGSRNNFIFSMACHLRYICNDDPDWIAKVLPTYGEEREKLVATVKSACQRIQTKVMPRIIKRTLDICRKNS